MQEIPLLDLPHQSLLATIGINRFRFTVWWQPSDEHWYLNVDKVDGTAMAHGRRLVEGGVAAHSLALGGSIKLDGVGIPDRQSWAKKTHRLVFTAD